MKICVYSPYVPEHTGGGEKYLFDVARILATRHQVQVALPANRVPKEKTAAAAFFNTVRRQYEQFLNVSLADVEFVSSPLGTTASVLSKLWWTLTYDEMYYATDGSLFFSLAGRNILHIQVPLKLSKTSWIERLKLANWQVKNSNSEFTKAVIEKSWQTEIQVVHQPMVELELPKHIAKEKIILNVGRFFRQLHSKRQDILVETFKELRSKYSVAAKGWKLVLIGGVEDAAFAKEISKQSKGLPIEILHDVSRSDLLKWYAKASIYWHAAGYGIDETESPEKVEHFGISTVEAMAAGCVPIVLAKGGQKEILGAELRDWGWQTPAEGAKKTAHVLKNATLRQELADQAQLRAALFDERTFEKKLWQMVEGES